MLKFKWELFLNVSGYTGVVSIWFSVWRFILKLQDCQTALLLYLSSPWQLGVEEAKLYMTSCKEFQLPYLFNKLFDE